MLPCDPICSVLLSTGFIAAGLRLFSILSPHANPAGIIKKETAISKKNDQDNHGNQLNPNNDGYWESEATMIVRRIGMIESDQSELKAPGWLLQFSGLHAVMCRPKLPR